MEKEDLKGAMMVPINRFIVMTVEQIETASVVLPGNLDNPAATGRALLLVVDRDDKCERVKKGDYVILKLGAKLAKFNILEDNYLMCPEDDVGVVIRIKK